MSTTLHKLGSMLDRSADIAISDKLGIGFSQFRILMAIDKNIGQAQNRIAFFLGQTEAAVSRQISLLVDEGLLMREQKEDNRREHVLTITSKGKAMLEKVWMLFDDLHKEIFQDLSEAELDVAQITNDKILNRLQNIVCGPKMQHCRMSPIKITEEK